MTPGDARKAYENGSAARQVLNDAEDDLKTWEANRGLEPAGGEAAYLGNSSEIPPDGEIPAESGAAGTLTNEATQAGNEEFTSASSSPSRNAQQ